VLSGLEFARAWALIALLLPALLWWFARKPRPPRERATGTLAIWHEVLSDPNVVTGRRAHGVPPRLYWTLLALLLGSLALAGPVLRRAAEAQRRVVLDTSPSMFLPWSTPDGEVSGRLRIEVALDLARKSIDGPVLWRRFDGARWEEAPGDAPPEAWLQATNLVQETLPWSEEDRPDSLWVTDRAAEPRAAAWVASGGGAVDGLVGVRGVRRIEVRAGALVDAGPATARAYALSAELPELVVALTHAWAQERGLVRRSGVPLALEVLGSARAEGERRVQLGGWTLTGRAAAAPRGTPVWRDTQGEVVLGTAPGRLELALTDPVRGTTPARVDGDRQAFALRWIDALEAAVLPRDGVVSLSERGDAGPGGSDPGTARFRDASLETAPIAVWLAILALSCAALGMRWLVAGRRSGAAGASGLRI